MRSKTDRRPTESIQIRFDPRTETKRMVCPHCDRLLPFDTVTECDRCGAYLRTMVRTESPPIKHSE